MVRRGIGVVKNLARVHDDFSHQPLFQKQPQGVVNRRFRSLAMVCVDHSHDLIGGLMFATGKQRIRNLDALVRRCDAARTKTFRDLGAGGWESALVEH